MLRILRRGVHQQVMLNGGALSIVCCPNLLGEVTEWLGFDLIPGLSQGARSF